MSADVNPAPIGITVGAQLPASYLDKSDCGCVVSQTTVTVDGVGGTRYDEGPCTSPNRSFDSGPDLYYMFHANGDDIILDYNRFGTGGLDSTFDTMVMEGIRFSS